MDTLGVFFRIQMSTFCFSDGLIVVNVTSFVSRHPARSKQGCPIHTVNPGSEMWRHYSSLEKIHFGQI